ncbi:uncharacterized protein TrAFT101_007476 [Trichoderma asperellum]|nr:hypothetical protein TrAFT101_007476 [Trichoderma asperellum]
MERKGPAIQGTTDFGLSGHSTTITLHGHPYSNQVLLPSSYTQRRTVSDAHYNMMANSQYMTESAYNFSSMEDALHAQPAARSLKIADSEQEAYRPTKARKTVRKTKISKRGEHTKFLSRALSVISSVPQTVVLKNAELFATRATEVRLDEADKAGKIKRPLNAFMLYRKFYQDVAKTCCTKNNHQQVSTVCGDSWKNLESSQLVREFTRLAAEERKRHVEAFPSYKYDPLHSKKRDDKDSMLSLPLDKGDFEHSGDRALPEDNKVKRKKKDLSEHHGSLQLGNEMYPPTFDDQQVFMARPYPPQAYWTPALQVQPAPYYTGNYVDHDQFQGLHVWSSEDSLHGGNAQPLITGLQGVPMERGLSVQKICVDPKLFYCPPSSKYDLPNSSSSAAQEQWNQGGPSEASHTDPVIPGVDVRGSYDAYLKGTDSDWKVEHLEEPSQFDDWMSQVEGGI